MALTYETGKVFVRSAEAELLLCCAQPTFERNETRVRALIEKGIDWETLYSNAQQHKVIPQLYWSLGKVAREAVPGDWLERLRVDFLAITKSNLYLTGTLLQLTKLFEDNGIRAIPYKGPVLAKKIYNHLAMRQYIDLDFIYTKVSDPTSQFATEFRRFS